MKLTLHIDEVGAQTLVDGLSQLPYHRVYLLIPEIAMQVNAQMFAAQAQAEIGMAAAPDAPRPGRRNGKIKLAEVPTGDQ
jgi:hypothetical protein